MNMTKASNVPMWMNGHAADNSVSINGSPLSPERSLKLRNHSPDGFCWGYNGSGPAQLSLAILLELTNDEGFAINHYQDFKESVIAAFLKDKDWVLPTIFVEAWIKVAREEDRGKN